MGVVREQVRDASRAFESVFSNRDLRRINLALVGSVVGDWAFSIAVSVWAYQEDGATGVGIYGVTRFVALALLAPLASSFADKFPRKRVMISADVIRAVLVGLAAILVASDVPAILVYALALVTGSVGSAFRPAQASLIPTLADSPAELTNANVVASTVESVGFFVGPAIAGLLLAATNLWVVFLFNAFTFVWSAAILVGLGAPRRGSVKDEEPETAVDGEPDAAVDGGENTTGRVLAGFGTIRHNRDLRVISLLFAAQTVVAGASLVYGVAIVFELLERGESTLGLMNAVVGVGGLCGGVLAALLAKREQMAMNFGLGVIGWAAPLLLIVVWPTLVAVLIAQVIIGISNSIVDINAFTIVQRVTPAAVMGRVFGALESIVIAGMALGSLLMPILLALIGVRGALAVLGIGVTLVSLLAMGRLREIDDRVLAPPLLRLVRAVPLLSVLTRPAQERLSRALEPLEIPPGEPVFREGDIGDRFWIIRSGRVAVTGNGVHLRDLGPGDSFGEIALLRDVARTATVTAIDDVSLVGLERDDFIPVVTGSEEAKAVAENVVNRYLGLA